MTKENAVKLIMLIGLLILFLSGSRFHAEHLKAECSEGLCSKPHDHGELNYHERFHIEHEDNFMIATLKSCANFWEANATGMTFAIIIGAAALSLLLSWNKFEKVLALKGISGAAIGSIFGMPLNMCANCSAVTSVSINAKSGSAETTLGIILGGALLNIVGIVTMFGLFSPAVVISRIVFSLIMILFIIPMVSKWVKGKSEPQSNKVLDMICAIYPRHNLFQIILKSIEDWLIAVGNVAYKLIPLMIVGTLLTAVFRVIFPNEILQSLTSYSNLIIIAAISFIGTLLSIPVMFEILLGTILLQLGFSNGAIAAMVFTAPSFGLFTLVLTKEKLGGVKVPLILIGITFIFGIGAGLFADFLSKFI
jgi:uncharacterized membrane protein YraQ (UPF0718 family)